MSTRVNDDDLDLIFRNARTYVAWRDEPVDDALLREVYDLAKLGPTSANMCPMRIVFAQEVASLGVIGITGQTSMTSPLRNDRPANTPRPLPRMRRTTNHEFMG